MYRCYKEKKFSAGSMVIIERARELTLQYARDGYDMTLRQLYYRFVANGWLANKQTEYKRLGSIINDARMAGLIDWDHLVDRTRNLRTLPHWDTPDDIIRAISRQYREERWSEQPERVEVWVEKEALAGVVQRVAERWDVPWFACRGYVSQSEQWAAAQRLGQYLAAGQPVTILHLGDHDPSGVDMTRDNRERLNDFVVTDALYDLDLDEDGTGASILDIRGEMEDSYGIDCDKVTVKRIALNMDQIEAYDPPPNPAKFTDSRVAGYVEEFGYQSWELDALPPDVLDALIETEIQEILDPQIWNESTRDQAKARTLLQSASRRWHQVAEWLEENDADFIAAELAEIDGIFEDSEDD